MIEILHGTNIHFMKYRKWAYLFSGLVLLVGFASLAMKGGPKAGIDFAGGQLLSLRFNQVVRADDLRHAADTAGLVGAEIQSLEGSNDALFRVAQHEGEGSATEKGPAVRIQEALQQQYPGITVEILRQEVVGPKVGHELRGKATLAVIFSVIAIMIYVALRFKRWEFGLGAAIALFHDILVTLGIFSILNKEIGLTVLAAFLTIAGYSINDTIVVFDRVRENVALKKKGNLPELMNLSINQTLSRTILTVFTVMLTAAAIYFLGGEVLHDFALAMLVGVGFGTYSSIYVASALALDLDNWRQKRVQARAAQRAAAKPAQRSGSAKTAASSKSTVAAR